MLFDGVDTTDPTTGTFGANQNFDTIQEVVVSNAAVSAEYGRFQGGVFNVVTKTGTNQFHGTRPRARDERLLELAEQGHQLLNDEPFARDKIDENAYNYSFTLGGPVWTDRIFFFGAYQRNPQVVAAAQTQTSSTLPDGTGQSYSQTPTFVAWQGKLSGDLTSSQSLTFSAQADPYNGIVRDYWGAAADTAALTDAEPVGGLPVGLHLAGALHGSLRRRTSRSKPPTPASAAASASRRIPAAARRTSRSPIGSPTTGRRTSESWTGRATRATSR